MLGAPRRHPRGRPSANLTSVVPWGAPRSTASTLPVAAVGRAAQLHPGPCLRAPRSGSPGSCGRCWRDAHSFQVPLQQPRRRRGRSRCRPARSAPAPSDQRREAAPASRRGGGRACWGPPRRAGAGEERARAAPSPPLEQPAAACPTGPITRTSHPGGRAVPRELAGQVGAERVAACKPHRGRAAAPGPALDAPSGGRASSLQRSPASPAFRRPRLPSRAGGIVRRGGGVLGTPLRGASSPPNAGVKLKRTRGLATAAGICHLCPPEGAGALPARPIPPVQLGESRARRFGSLWRRQRFHSCSLCT